VALNFWSSLLGLALYALLWQRPAERSPSVRGAWSAVPYSAAILVMVNAAFLSAVQLGHLVYDPEVGSFRSSYTGAELKERSAQREAALLAGRLAKTTIVPQPGVTPEQRRWTIEDPYLSEGHSRLQMRNKLMDKGSWGAALAENMILDRYYHSVLEETDQAWAADEESRVLALAGGGPPRRYLSPLNRQLLTTLGRGTLFAVSLAGAGGLVLAGWALRRLEDRRRNRSDVTCH
jgi:hypothetical protein